jgi:S-adenosylmethionine:tRNA ribosyltransferase-isomerase
VLFGAGDWRTRTEERPAPPIVRPGDALFFADGGSPLRLRATITGVAEVSPRLVELTFDATPSDLWPALYRLGRPVQYAHVSAPLALWHVQTPFASRPWASEMPCAARPLAWEALLAIRARGVRIARVTHAAGLSSTGDAGLDAALPLRESFEVGAEAVAAIRDAQERGGRVVAIGTSAVRALEAAAAASPDGALREARGETDLLVGVGADHPTRVATAILTGMHAVGTSHDALLHAFAPEALLARARDEATARGFLEHEFGDSMILLPGALAAERRAARTPVVSVGSP